jgi:hypothetical protein
MAKPNVTWLYNNTANDGANTGNASGGAGGSSSNWVVIDRTLDKLLFLASQQLDGDSISGTKYPAIIPASSSAESPKTFISDYSAGVYDQVPLAGTSDGGQSGGNTRYVFAIYFDGATAGTPQLEAWDTTGHTTAASTFLGAGTPANSTIRAIATTNGVPGSATWTGSSIAGANVLLLDTGALSSAKNLYFNIKQVIPSTFTPADASNVLTLRYLYS